MSLKRGAVRRNVRAVFLDRDGTINREVNVLKNIRQLKLLPGVARAIARLNALGFVVVVITNQAVIARGGLLSGFGRGHDASFAGCKRSGT